MALKLNNALGNYERADMAEIDCGGWAVTILQMAQHNQLWRARIAEFQKKHSAKLSVSSPGATDVDPAKDAEFLFEMILVDWSLKDDDGKDVKFTLDNAVEVFSSKAGQVLMAKLFEAARNDKLFTNKDLVKN